MRQDEGHQQELEEQRQAFADAWMTSHPSEQERLTTIAKRALNEWGKQMTTNAELYAALSKAQAKIKGAVKDSTNPFFKSKYADLAACFEAIRAPFAENGLAVIQLPQNDPLRIVTMIVHSSGASIQDGGVAVKPTKDDPQGMGSAMTYARRYGLTAMCGLPQIDDDGNAASEPAPSAFKSKQMKTKVWNALKDAAAEHYAVKARETWDELSSDEQQEVWRELSSGQRSTIKKLLAETKESE